MNETITVAADNVIEINPVYLFRWEEPQHAPQGEPGPPVFWQHPAQWLYRPPPQRSPCTLP